MIDRHIRKTKIHFSIGLMLLLVTLVSGMTTFRSVPYLSYDFVIKQLNYLKYSYLVGGTRYYSSDANGKAVSVPVLVYHGLSDDSDGKQAGDQSGEGINISPEKFFDQMSALKKSGWNTVSIYDFNDFMQGKKDLPKKSFLLTFDDGRRESYFPADPILKALDFRATMFVITGRSLDASKKNSFSLSEMELKEMVKSGRWDIQSHGKFDHDLYRIDSDNKQGHFLSNKLWKEQGVRMETQEEYEERIKDDLNSSKKEIEQKLGVNVIGFAFPFSDYGNQSLNYSDAETVVSAATKSIYPMAFYQVSSGRGFGFNYPFHDPEENSLLVKRIKFPVPLSGADLVRYLNTSSEKKLPFEDKLQSNSGWYGTWGSVSVTNGVLLVGANNSTSGGAVFLDGSQYWADYVFSVVPKQILGESISLLARYVDEENFIECTYSERYVRLTQYISGEKNLIREVKTEDLLFDGKTLAVRVVGSSTQCIVNNTTLISGDLKDGTGKGIIGIKTWDPQINNSQIIIKKVSAEEIL